MAETREIVVIGAGMAGVTAARALADAGADILVLDKGRGLGGRLATRRIEGVGAFDHGAPWAQGGAGFMAAMARLAAAGAVRHQGERALGLPGMSGLLRPWAKGLEIRQGAEVVRAERRGAWALTLADGAEIAARRLVSTIPAPQAARLFAALPRVALPLAGVVMEPCWTLMAAFGALPALDPSPEVRVVIESEKPGRAPGLVAAHAAPGWSAEHLELSRDAAVPRLLALLGAGAAPTHAAAHRWRYARASTPLGAPFVAAEGLHVGGDWCLGPQAGDAWESGRAMAADLIA